MPFLEILHFTGDAERRDLSKQQPMTIGSHSSNDICIDEEGVEIMHCRISWGKKGYEAVAAGVDGIDVNGTQMQQAVLKAGDVLRFGTVDIRFRESENDGADAPAAAQQDELGLKPISGEFPAWEQPSERFSEPAPAKPPKESEKPSAKKPKSKPAAAKSRSDEADDGGGIDLLAGLDALAAESRGGASRPEAGRAGKKKQTEKPRPPEPEEESKQSPPPPKPSSSAAEDSDSTDDEEDGLSSRMRQAMRSQQRRPGEEDPLRSPLVLGLAGGSVALILTGAIFYFIAGRQTTQQRFDAAKAFYDDGNYISGIKALQDFLVIHPRDNLAKDAKKLLGLARIRQHIDGASPSFPEGLEQLRVFINEQRDLDGFETLHPEIMTHARTISLGAAVAAGRQFTPPLLETSREARTILRTYAPKDAPPTETLQQIEQALRASESAIRKNDVYKEHVANIEAALETEKAPLKALKLRRDLLVRYPEFDRDRTIASLLEKTLAAEQARVAVLEAGREAVAVDHEFPENLLTLAAQGRTRTDEVAVGRAVIVVAKDCCYGIEFVTGEPLWRRVIGLDSPFFPLVESNLPSVILFDTNHRELVRLHQVTGKLIWRLPLGEAVTGQPILTDGTVYAATESGRLLAVDLDTGRLAGELEFSQKITGPVEFKNQTHLAVAGDEEVVYTVSKRPFACSGVSYFGQQAGTVEAPLIGMGSYLLMIENKANAATLRLIETETGGKPLAEVARANVIGRVVDPPVIRGRDLFVPSTGERVSAFSVSDDPGQPPLTAGPAYQGEGEHRGPVHLLTGPDRQVWMATGKLSKLRLTTEALQPDRDGAPGISTQPLQFISGYILNARRRPYGNAVTFTRTTDRGDELTSDWQAVVGGDLIAWTVRDGDPLNIAAINDAGIVFRVGQRQLSEGPFLKTESNRLQLNPDLADPLLAASVLGDRIAVACGGPEPRMWLINAAGQFEGNAVLPSPPQAAPANIGPHVAVPLAGRIHVFRRSGQPAVQDFALPTGEAQTWVNLVSSGTDKGIAVTADGLILLLKAESSPRPHLGETARVELKQSVSQPGAAGDGLYAVADASRKVSLFDGERLDPRGARTFEQPVTNRPWIVGGRLFVEEGFNRLHCIEPASDLPIVWTLDLEQSSVSGIGLQGETCIVARQDGTISFLDRETGTVQGTRPLGTPLSGGPIIAGPHAFVVTIDGTLIRIPPDGRPAITETGGSQ